MLRRFKSFVRRHRHAEEVAGEAIGLDLLWTILRAAGFFGAGIAAAAIVSTSSAPPARVAVPQRLALETPVQKQLVRFAHRYGPASGIVYVWGGDGPFGFDCSGFVNFVYRKVGITIPRDSRSQWTSLAGRDIAKNRVRPGDAVYFVGSTSGVNAGPPPGHVGLYIGGGKFIQYYSSGKPAVVSRLADMRDYMGGKRWWQPITVAKHDAHLVFWFAHHFHVKIANASSRTVTFKPWRGHGHFARWKYRQLVRWARNQHHRVNGSRRRRYLQVHFG